MIHDYFHGSRYAHVYITHAIFDRLSLRLPVYKYLSALNMKQTAVVFEAKIRSAGSAVDLNNMSRADNIQGESAVRDEQTGREKRGVREDMCKEAFSQAGRMCLWREQVNFLCSGLQGRNPGNPIASQRESLLHEVPPAGFLLSLPANCHQTGELFHDLSQRQPIAL